VFSVVNALKSGETQLTQSRNAAMPLRKFKTNRTLMNADER